MDYSSISLLNTMKTKLQFLSERQVLLAKNVANADTPHYTAQDIKEPDFKSLMKQSGAAGSHNLRVAITDSKHLLGKTKTTEFKVINNKKTQELNPNGNNVVIEEEVSKAAMNQAEYQKVLNLYGKTVSMFKTAIGNPNG